MKSSYRKLTVLWRVLRAIIPPDICNLNPILREYETFLAHLVQEHGLRIATKYLKTLFNQGKRLSLHLPLDPDVFPFWCQVDNYGFPKRLPRIRKLLCSRVMRKRIGLTILNAYLLLRVQPVANYKSIIGRYTGKRQYSTGGTDFHRFLDWYLKRFRNFPMRRPKDLFLTKSGPYGKPSILESVESAAYLESTAGRDLRDSILELYGCLGGDEDDLRQRLVHLAATFKGKTPFYACKVTPIPDRGGKTRHVASSIYWTQVSLYPIHDYYMRILRTLKTDFTYRQEESIDVVQKWMREGRLVDSIDLSDATDRFPIKLQYEVVKRMLGSQIADLWRFLMLQPFFTSSGRMVDYRVGQPMGMYSSFPIFAFSHHCVVQYCSWVVKGSTTLLYCLLGDDINIAHRAISKCYRCFLRLIGVKYSPTKTLRSRRGNLVSEFAKQIVWNGKLLTPLTPDRLVVMKERYWTLITELCLFLVDRWRFKVPNQLHTPSVVKILDRKAKILSRRDLSNPMVSYKFIDSPGVKEWVEEYWLGEFGRDSQRSYRLCLEGALVLRLKQIEKETEELLFKFITPLSGVMEVDETLDWADLIWDSMEEKLFKRFKELGSSFTHPVTRFSVRLGWKAFHMLMGPKRLLKESEVASIYVELLWLKKLLANDLTHQDKHLEMEREMSRSRRAAAAAFRGESKALLAPYYDV